MTFPTALSQAVFIDRYALRDTDGQQIESTWEEAAERLATATSAGDHQWTKDAFYDILQDFRFIPGGRIINAIGSPAKVSPYNCFVLPSPADSCHGIMQSLERWMEIQRRGGGVGINMSTLRPHGSIVKGVNGTSSGPLAWMELFSTMTHKVIQQGGSRRGAAMLILADSHPDVLEFIEAKRKPGALEGANVSVAISDSFMQAVQLGSSWDLHWGGEVYRTVPAQLLWNGIIQAAWSSGEPGVVFLDRMNKESNARYCEELVATNPCAEQPLGPNAVCLLGSINVLAHMREGLLDVNSLKHTVEVAVRFLDNIIDLAYYPFVECEVSEKGLRRMGLGTAGLADALIASGLRYGSEDACRFTALVFKTIRDAAYEASIKLAQERGAFPWYTDEYLDGQFIGTLDGETQLGIQKHGIRNAFLTSQAPTGTIAKLAGVWAGIEPYFDRSTIIRNRLGEHKVVAPDSEFVVTADEVSPEEHIDMMVAAQAYIDSAVSKTVNAPHDQTVAETAKVYKLAYSKGLKSVAYYRDRSRSLQVQYKGAASECSTGDGACA